MVEMTKRHGPSSFETRLSGAPQDEGQISGLMVRSTPEACVSNHEAGHEAL